MTWPRRRARGLKATVQSSEAAAAAGQELLTELAVARAGSVHGSQGQDDLKVAVEAAEGCRDLAALQGLAREPARLS